MRDIPYNFPTYDVSRMPPSKEPSEQEVESMRQYLESGCVTTEYLDQVTGGVSEVVSVLPHDDCGDAEASCD